MATNAPGAPATPVAEQPGEPPRRHTIHYDCEPRHHHDCGPRHHHDCGPDHCHHESHGDCCPSCGKRHCDCGCKPFRGVLELAPEICALGIRLAETVLALPLVVATNILEEATKCLPKPCCEEHHDKCCDEGRYHHRGTADIHMEAREGDIHHRVILVQNNGPQAATVTFVADPWTDLSGNSVGTAPAITFDPPSVTLAPCESLESTAQISVAAPLTPGKTYLTRIHFQGSGARSLLVELCVVAKNQVDNCVETDPCRRHIGKYVDVCDDDREEHHSCCHSRKFDPCEPSHGKPWHWQRDPWHWCGPDPYRFWYGVSHWQRLLFPNIAGQRCC